MEVVRCVELWNGDMRNVYFKKWYSRRKARHVFIKYILITL